MFSGKFREKTWETPFTCFAVIPKKAARIAEKVLKSVIANAEQKGLDLDRLYIKKAVADDGPILKKWIPRAHGRATMVRKRLSHITIVLEEKPEGKEEE
ncbi:ribosomal protein L22 [Aquifex aeolicus VF5]|nr:ribosomal protein L22 [Aquifex aeolicus VF5]